MRKRLALTAAVALLVVHPTTAQRTALVVSAAASLADVMSTLTTTYRDEAGVELRVNTGGSNTLARQIVEGARVDVFLSADAAQMDVVEQAGRLVPGSRADVVANALVVIVPEDAPAAVTRAADLAGAGVRRIAMGNPASVPAGVYGRRWLEKVSLWTQVSPKVVPLPTVRAALAAVQEGRADAGIVYATDARVTSAVRVALVVPDDEAPAVVYPAAAIRGSQEEAAARFLSWLRGPTAMRVFTDAGFRTVEP